MTQIRLSGVSTLSYELSTPALLLTHLIIGLPQMERVAQGNLWHNFLSHLQKIRDTVLQAFHILATFSVDRKSSFYWFVDSVPKSSDFRIFWLKIWIREKNPVSIKINIQHLKTSILKLYHKDCDQLQNSSDFELYIHH